MKNSIKQLLDSKKFKVALIAVAAWLVSLLGFDVSQETIAAVLSPLYLYIFAQGFADMNPNNKKPTTTTTMTTTTAADMIPTTATVMTTTSPSVAAAAMAAAAAAAPTAPAAVPADANEEVVS